MVLQTTPPAVGYTAEQLWEAPDDGNRYEVIYGELFVTTSPDWIHQYGSANLHLIVGNHVKQHRLGYVVAAPVGVVLAPRVGLQPDLVYVSDERANIITQRGIYGVPDLVVEILSPSTEDVDRGTELRTYAAAGVPHYWLLDPRTRALEPHELRDGAYVGEGIFGPGTTYQPPLLHGLQIAIDEIRA
jgi:Uma2 family endonuclease